MVLGAGASYCYEDGEARIPMQTNFFRTMLENGMPYSVAPGQKLAIYLSRMNKEINNGHDVVLYLAEQQIGIEQLYEMVENDRINKLITEEEFQAISEELFQVTYHGVALPVSSRNDKKRACRYHAKIAQALEPGDIVVSFNYDFLIDDALTWFNEYWNPLTGYAIDFDGLPVGGIPTDCVNAIKKIMPHQSKINVFHPHGSILFSCTNELKGINPGLPFIRLVGFHEGIQQYTFISSSYELNGRNYTLKPLIVPPSPSKDQMKAYTEKIMGMIKKRLKYIKAVIFIGYSFPEADLAAISLFSGSCKKKQISVINPSNDRSDFCNHYRAIIKTPHINFKEKDFKAYANAL